MVRLIDTSMRTRLDSETLTLTTCWKVSRTDGQVFYLTESSDNIVFDGQTYLASDTYDRTAIESNVSLSPDNLEVFAILNSGTINANDLKSGKFDGADVEVFLVDWSDPDAFGKINLRTGWFGEIKPLADGLGFTTELLGLADRLRANLEKTITAECSADLGDSLCRVPITPPEIERNTAYNLGDYVRVRTRTLAPVGAREILVNGDFSAQAIDTRLVNTDNPPGWSSGGGIRYIREPSGTGIPDYATHSIAFSFDGSHHTQLRELAGDNITEDMLDNGECWVFFQVYGKLPTRGDTFSVYCDLEDNDGNVTDTVFIVEDITDSYAIDDWVRFSGLVRGITPGSRKARVRLVMNDLGTAVTDGSWALAECKVIAFDDTQSSELDFEDRIYRCTVAGTTSGTQPSYDTTISAETIDGTTTWVCEQAYRVPFVCIQGRSRELFRGIPDYDSRGENDERWYDDGVVYWLTGGSSGRATEIKKQIFEGQGVYEFRSWLPLPETPELGDLGFIHPGCGRERTSCRDKFDNILNYRGFPDLPGNDHVSRFYARK